MDPRSAMLTVTFVLLSSLSVSGQNLPELIQSYLNANYAGWRLGPTTGEYCSAEYRSATGVGDFDGDTRRDYVVKFVKGSKAYLIAFLDRKTRYAPFVLTSTPAKDAVNWGMQIASKGQVTTAGRLKNNGILVGECSSEAGIFVYRNGKFKAY